jgi:hypothetical protein
MSRSKAKTRPAHSSSLIPSAPHIEFLLAMAGVALAAYLVYSSALDYFFAQDDFMGLARASGVAPRLEGIWRYLSGQTYFDLMWTIAGRDPYPYHLVSLVAHATCGALLFAWLRRHFATSAAFVGTVFFVVHPALFAALFSVSGIGEILAAVFVLACFLVYSRDDRWRVLAIPFFVLSLLSKESLILFPIVAWLHQAYAPIADPTQPEQAANEDSTGKRRYGLLLTLAAISVAYAAYFTSANVFSIQASSDNPAYEIAVGDNLWQNLLTYTGWAANFLYPTVEQFQDEVDKAVYPYAVGAIVIWFVGLALPPLRRRAWFAGGLTFVLFLVPVLFLTSHTYHYYLYGALIGSAWCLAALIDAIRAQLLAGRKVKERSKRKKTHSRVRPGISPVREVVYVVLALAICLGLFANGKLLVKKIETHPGYLPRHRAYNLIDRALIAARAYETLQDSEIPAGTRLLLISARNLTNPVLSEEDTLLTSIRGYVDANVRTALLHGIALRVLIPELEEVRFIRYYEPQPPPYLFGMYSHVGEIGVGTSGWMDEQISILKRTGRRVE